MEYFLSLIAVLRMGLSLCEFVGRVRKSLIVCNLECFFLIAHRDENDVFSLCIQDCRASMYRKGPGLNPNHERLDWPERI
jgi:hypothetical protein